MKGAQRSFFTRYYHPQLCPGQTPPPPRHLRRPHSPCGLGGPEARYLRSLLHGVSWLRRHLYSAKEVTLVFCSQTGFCSDFPSAEVVFGQYSA